MQFGYEELKVWDRAVSFAVLVVDTVESIFLSFALCDFRKFLWAFSLTLCRRQPLSALRLALY